MAKRKTKGIPIVGKLFEVIISKMNVDRVIGALLFAYFGYQGYGLQESQEQVATKIDSAAIAQHYSYQTSTMWRKRADSLHTLNMLRLDTISKKQDKIIYLLKNNK